MSTQNLHTDVYSSFIHDCQNLETPKCPLVGKWVNCGAPRQWNSILG